MTYEIKWGPAALHVLRELPLHTAMLVDRAVLRFVEHGEGEIVDGGPYVYLRAGRHEAVLVVVPAEERVTVLHVLAYRKRAPRAP